MRTPPRLRAAFLVLAGALAALAVPASASALTFHIVNESGLPAEEVFVDFAANGAFEVPGFENDKPRKLSEIAGQEVTIEKLVSGRVYISYGAAVEEGVTTESPTRFDWAEMSVTPSSSDVANLTAVDQFAIGMRLTTFGASNEELESVGDANADTIFKALQAIPGGAEATVRDPEGNILRVLSPLHSTAYPLLGDYVRSLAGQTITLHTAFFSTPFVTTEYSGTFQPDGSITLTGTTNPLGEAPETIELEGEKLINDIYTGDETPNDVEGTIRRDLLSGFSAGFWDGKYGNDALSFCSDPIENVQGKFCPQGFNQPAFGDARSVLSPFPTCEQYSAVINQYTDVYGNPYSDASKKVTVGLDQEGATPVDTLQLTILPDSGDAQPSTPGNSNCGAALPAAGGGSSTGGGNDTTSGGNATVTKKEVVAATPDLPSFHLLKEAKVKNGRVKIGQIACTGACGKVETTATVGKKTALARGKAVLHTSHGPLMLTLTPAGKRRLERGAARTKLTLKVTQPGTRAVAERAGLRLLP